MKKLSELEQWDLREFNKDDDAIAIKDLKDWIIKQIKELKKNCPACFGTGKMLNHPQYDCGYCKVIINFLMSIFEINDGDLK
jgi:ribosomal protein S27AE